LPGSTTNDATVLTPPSSVCTTDGTTR
jgi:hypothetical protein